MARHTREIRAREEDCPGGAMNIVSSGSEVERLDPKPLVGSNATCERFVRRSGSFGPQKLLEVKLLHLGLSQRAA